MLQHPHAAARHHHQREAGGDQLRHREREAPRPARGWNGRTGAGRAAARSMPGHRSSAGGAAAATGARGDLAQLVERGARTRGSRQVRLERGALGGVELAVEVFRQSIGEGSCVS